MQIQHYTFDKVGIGTSSPRARLDLGNATPPGEGLRVGTYLELTEGPNNTAAITINALRATTSKFKPYYAGNSNASGMVIKENTGGRGRLDFWGALWGTDTTALSVGSMNHIISLTPEGRVGIGGIAVPQRDLHVNDVMRLEPRATAPTSPSKGDIYMDDTTNKLMVYDGTAWQACW